MNLKRLSALLFILLYGCASPVTETQKTADVTPQVVPAHTLEATTTPALTAGATQVSPQDGMVMLYVPGGDFSMGSETFADEKPQRTLSTEAYWIDQTEVTQAMYARCVQAGACEVTRSSLASDASHEKYPVVTDNWNQAQAYCTWAGRRLPSEAEWEKAARGTDGRTYPWGEAEASCSLANVSGCAGETQAVGNYPAGASPYGALDMAGNVWEWVTDVYPGTSYHILKGGDWQTVAWGVRSAVRGGDWEAKGRLLWGESMAVPWYDCYGTRYDWYCDYRGNDAAMSGGFRCALSP